MNAEQHNDHGQPATDAPATSSTDAELEALLADAENEIRAIRAELAARKQAQMDKVLDDLPHDLSAVQGKWSDLRRLLRALTHDEPS